MMTFRFSGASQPKAKLAQLCSRMLSADGYLLLLEPFGSSDVAAFLNIGFVHENTSCDFSHEDLIDAVAQLGYVAF